MERSTFRSGAEPDRLAGLRPALELRSRVLFGIRHFFTTRNFLEAETPVRLPYPALETHIDAEPSGSYFLRTSPELHMKRMLAAGYDRIFQVGPCFRKGERGNRHHPEYTMLEWYRTGTDYLGILDDTQHLVQSLARLCSAPPALQMDGPWRIITVANAFMTWAGWDPTAHYDAERFDMDLVEKVEPSLPRNQPVVLIDYPAEAGALARRKPDVPHLAERWELYLNGLEIANAYSELTDANEQAVRFAQAAKDRTSMGKPVYEVDPAFMAALETGIPPSGGIALGIDRLIMAFLGSSSLDDVMAFRE
jgi:lysyl-tRNA synthetase class 2